MWIAKAQQKMWQASRISPQLDIFGFPLFAKISKTLHGRIRYHIFCSIRDLNIKRDCGIKSD